MDTISPPPAPQKAFTNPDEAWAYLAEIYHRNTDFHPRAPDRADQGHRAQGPRARLLSRSAGHLAELRQDRLHARLWLSPLPRASIAPRSPRRTCSRTIWSSSSQVILANHGGAIEVGESATRIPLHFALSPDERLDGEAINACRSRCATCSTCRTCRTPTTRSPTARSCRRRAVPIRWRISPRRGSTIRCTG